MSGPLDGIRAALSALQRAPADAARDVADLLGARMRTGHAEVRGNDVALVPGGSRDTFLSPAWEVDAAKAIADRLKKAGGA